MPRTDSRIVVIGAAGEMTQTAVEQLAIYETDHVLVLADIDETKARSLANRLAPGRAVAAGLDLFDEQQLDSLVAGARLVINGAGPYTRTAAPVMRACIAAGVDYIDLDDDNASTLHALELHKQARAAGVALLIGCGASPGLTNMLAVDAASHLDEVETIDVAWCVGDEGPRPIGRAVVEHLIDISAGECLTWRDGRRMVVPSFADSEIVSLAGGLGDYRLYEVAHPEAVTLPHTFPGATRIRCLGGLHPQPVNGMVRGIGGAVRDGRMTLDDCIAFFQAVMQDQNGTVAGWRHALRGVAQQLRAGEVSTRELARYLVDAARNHHSPFQGAVAATATGVKDGSALTVHLTIGGTATNSPLWTDMAAATGRSLAAFVRLALRSTALAGALPPEAWCEPSDLYAALEVHGADTREVRPETPVSPTRPAAEADSARDRIAADVAALSAIRRPSASPGEERAAKWVSNRLSDAGLRPELEHYSGHGGYWWPLGLPLALSALLTGVTPSRWAWAAAAAIPALVITDEVGGHRRVLRRRLPHRRGTSVCAEIPGTGDDAPTVIVVAHLDAAHMGLIFHPRWASLSARFVRRFADRTPPVAGTLLAGPALAALAAATGRRRLARAATVASLLGAGAMADVGLRGISPGANDNASGVAVLLELARSLVRDPARARVLLVASGGEEGFDEGFEAFIDSRLAQGLDPRRTVVVCVDTVGNSEHVLLDAEGMILTRRYPGEWNDWALDQAAAADITLRRGLINHSGTDGLIALARGLPAISLHSLAEDGSFGAYHWPTDTLDNLDVDMIERAARLCRVLIDAAPSGPFKQSDAIGKATGSARVPSNMSRGKGSR